MEKILKKENLTDWIDHLKDRTVYAPVKDGQHWDFQIIGHSGNIELDVPTNIGSPKKLIMPQREVLFEFDESGGKGTKLKEVVPDDNRLVIFGVRPCDAGAVSCLDKVFDGDSYKDPYFQKRRKQTTLVGMTCVNPPSTECFCVSVNGSPHSMDGLDILMTDLGSAFFIESITENGKELVERGDGLFQLPTGEEMNELKSIKENSEKKLYRSIDRVNEIPARLEETFESMLWEKKSLSCVKCGICTFLCPSCHCFDINDEVMTQYPLKGKRTRTWDNCQFPDFTMHSSGHNPRGERSGRLRQRVMHKFLYFFNKHGNFMCVGCGRCISGCPVGIDILEVLEEVKKQ